ncbi:benzoate/H(+) symporter BenE family transporter [Halomonas dongshanensis]|uniref:Benzoate/H(+) symporter BenE family transporter n=1 Tax=Halomonas dongshanensis TaxID=2890835 RepID=A0ABT2E8A4_9GAMM|nr:benzoate/H(+) symporter BenE family transporter [Halomonas dongshanensis]MCS2607802.1 benzoate/H(+) symporter BenE family transporter [Halomonas dongshanensis]
MSSPVAIEASASHTEPVTKRSLRHAFNSKSISAGVVAALFGCTGPALIIINAAEAGRLSEGQTVAWLFAVYVLGGLISLVLTLRYRQPLCGAFTIPGAAILIGSLGTIPFNEAIGAFIMSGLLVLILGITGLIGRLMRWLPMPIVMAMIAGALIRFATGAVDSVVTAPIVAGVAALSFFLVTRFAKSVPPVLVAGIVGIILAYAMGQLQPADVNIGFVMPDFTMPSFSLDAFLAITIPLTALVIGAENAQATGVLVTEGYRPPVNAMTVASGIGGILAGLLGGHNANIAGPMTAICSSEQAGEDRDLRYGAALINGGLFALFGLFAGLAVPFLLAFPKTLIVVIAGLAMLGVLLSALQQAFQKGGYCQMGAFIALAVAMSQFSVMGISSPFWALLFGVLVSGLLGEIKR